MAYEEMRKWDGAQPKEDEIALRSVGFKQTELKRTLLAEYGVLEKIRELICTGKSFRAELVCGAGIEGDYSAYVHLYTPIEHDKENSQQEH